MSTYSSLKIEEITVGDAGWGPTTTNNLLALQQAIAGMATLDSADFITNTAILTLTNTNALQDARAMCLRITATNLTGDGTVEVPAVEKLYLVVNDTSPAHDVTIKVAGQTGFQVPAGKGMWLYNNGTDIVNWANYVTSALSAISATNADYATNAGSAALATSATTAASATNATNVSNGSATNMLISSSEVVPRVVVIADGTSITMAENTTDIATQANTQTAGTLTINAPTGTPVNGQKIILRIRSTNVQTFSWNAIFAGSTDLALPTATSGSGKYDYMGFMYNSDAAKWQLLAKNFGF